MSPTTELHCTGVDLFVICKNGIPKVPETFGSLKLEFISERGMNVWPGPVPDGIISSWFRCRYIHSTRSAKVSDEEIISLTKEVSKTYMWEKAQKLFEINGKAAYSGGYAS